MRATSEWSSPVTGTPSTLCRMSPCMMRLLLSAGPPGTMRLTIR
eukprot:CAMPEP_0172085790 /NCGR_PEP_ID=MMETSP1043-20130122/21750_1 /TAXON_ID=464988 /ORGANISM="Hemiselmis andersenii, Strain CCMP441" /LENGTH=43 /DNA_ID= /DNA_START= /DNA_END= /DNA_ORIENTATION=